MRICDIYTTQWVRKIEIIKDCTPKESTEMENLTIENYDQVKWDEEKEPESLEILGAM